MMGCAGFGRFLLIFVNIMIMIAAVAMLGMGVCTMFVEGTFDYFVYAFPTIEKLNQALTDTGLGDENSYSSLTLDDAFTTIVMAVAISGGLILIIALIGCCGGCCRSRCLLGLNAAILSFLLVFELIVVILLYSDESILKNPLKMYTRKSIEKYNGFPGDNINSYGWNFGMIQYECCGVIDYEDFNQAKNWDKTVVTSSGTYSLAVPITCCSPLPTSGDLTCATNTTGNNAEKGCFDVLWAESFGHPVRTVVAYVGGFTIQILLIIFSIVLCKQVPGAVHAHGTKESIKMFYMKAKPQERPLPIKNNDW